MSRDRDKGFFGHPIGLRTLFFTEMWERLSYYGGRAMLFIYMTKAVGLGGRGMSEGAAGTVMALYLSSVYVLSLPGGWIADRFLGQRKSVTIGGIGIALGNAMLAGPDALFFPGLAVIALGTGFLKPNVSTIVGQLYGKEDKRRDAGFTIYYMGINIGAGAAPLVGMIFAQSQWFRGVLQGHGIDPNLCWKFAFAVPAIGMVAGVIQYLIGYSNMGDAGLKPTIPDDPVKAQADVKTAWGLALGIVGVIVGGLLFDKYVHPIGGDALQNVFGVGLVLASFGVFAIFFKSARDADETKRIIAMIPLFIGGIAFFMVFEQASTTMSGFAEHLVRRQYLGLHVTSIAYQFVNAGCILLLAPIFAWIWTRLSRQNKEPSSVNKFGIGTVFTLLSIVLLLPSLATISHVDGVAPSLTWAHPFRTVSPNYLMIFYVVSTCSELCISPVGLSSMSKLAPERLAGMVMGTWFLAAAIGNYLSGRAAQLSAANGYGFLFWVLIIASLLIAIALFAVAPKIKRMLGEDKGPPDMPEARVVKEDKVLDEKAVEQ
ncbi:MAG TPA: oligopeptide:H+ symporter [Kofleriaceae bacterium]|jgi:POT family proton-dependent oligopeptide transporter